MLQSIKNILALDANFNQITAYIDGTLNGKADREGTVLSPVVGHRVDDVIIDAEGSGQYMTQALNSGEIVMGKGSKDGMWFLVAPIGKFCCINFTTSERLTEYLVLETRDLMMSLLPTLDTAISKIIELSHRQGSSLQRLRSIIGPGSHDKQTAAIFIDIADYSKYTESLGNEYTGFISQTYLPSLIKILSPWATPEVVRGDEIYFVVLKELAKEDSALNTIAACALKRLQLFVNEDGKNICKANGFPTVDLRIGMTCGDANIVVDDIQVRTSGDHINRAKRLQDAAEKNEVWVDSSTAENLASEGIIVLKRKTIIVKKNVIEAVKVGVKRAA
jgi:class 3 adenylate cyclase